MSPLMWMALVVLAVMVTWLVMVAIAWAEETRPVRRINAAASTREVDR